MALSAFEDRGTPPTEPMLKRALGRAFGAWSGLLAELAGEGGGLEEEWAFAGPKFGWSLRLKQRRRVIVYLVPCAGQFLASLALGEKACAAARERRLPAKLLQRIEDAPRYAEGRGVRIPVRTAGEARGVRELAAIKLAN